MEIQRLRNLTTGILHTRMDHIYIDLGAIFGSDGLMTHQLGRVCEAITPFLRRHLTDARFWDGAHDPTHIGSVALPTPTSQDRDEMRALYSGQTDPLAGKNVLHIEV